MRMFCGAIVTPISSAINGNQLSYVNKTQRTHENNLSTLASGKKVNKAASAPAGLAVSMGLTSDISTLKQASSNLAQGQALLQTVDGALNQVGNIVTRMKDLATQANSGSLDANSRSAINAEYQNLAGELNNISSFTSFNGQNLLNGTFNQDFQMGKSVTDIINVNLTSVNTSVAGLGLTAANGANAGALLTPASAQATSVELNAALDKISASRSQVGSLQSRVSLQSDGVAVEMDAMQSALSVMVDADLGKASSDLASSKALTELSLAAALHGNKMQSSLLKLVR